MNPAPTLGERDALIELDTEEDEEEEIDVEREDDGDVETLEEGELLIDVDADSEADGELLIEEDGDSEADGEEEILVDGDTELDGDDEEEIDDERDVLIDEDVLVDGDNELDGDDDSDGEDEIEEDNDEDTDDDGDLSSTCVMRRTACVPPYSPTANVIKSPTEYPEPPFAIVVVATLSIVPSNTSTTEFAAAAQRDTPLSNVFLTGTSIFVVVLTGNVFAIIILLNYLLSLSLPISSWAKETYKVGLKTCRMNPVCNFNSAW